MSYRRAPHFARYGEELHDVYTRPWTRLVDVNLCLIALARRWLRIDVPMICASTLGLQGTKTDRLIDLCRKLGARAYLSGVGGSKTYLDEEQLGRAGVGVVWQHFAHPTYPQRHGAFVSHLAFVDMLFNCGEVSRSVLFDRAHPLHARAA
jgi:hypothetical protein